MNPEQILKKHQDFLNLTTRRYHYLGREDIYNQTYMYLLEAYQKGRSPETYANNRIARYAKNENKHRHMEHYGINPEDL